LQNAIIIALNFLSVITESSAITPSSSSSAIIDQTAQPKTNQRIRKITKKEERMRQKKGCLQKYEQSIIRR
jgi:hypothetical protein